MNDAGSFFKRLFADLRDRHLLPVIAVLLVALIAIPMLMGSDEAPPATSAADGAVAVEPAFETDPVVLASQPELRSFRKRLKTFQTRNPFNQYLPKNFGEEGSQDATEALPSDDGTGATDTGASIDNDTGLDDTSLDDVLPPTDGGDEPLPPVVEDDDGGGDGGSGDSGARLLTTRIDVLMGPVGKVKKYTNVKYLDFLPDRRTPVVEYLQADFDLTNAVFIVSGFVLDAEGDGKCAPTPSNCQFLQLEVGEEHAFQYDDGKRYRLKLLDVDLHEQPLPEDTEEAAGRTPQFGTTVPSGKIVGG